MELLRRDNKVLGLTPAGETLRREAEDLLRQAEEIKKRVRESGREA